MRPTDHSIKKYFDSYSKKEGKSSLLSQSFWTPNDHFSLAEILPPINNSEESGANQVSILVGESDIFSITDKLVSETIIICDIVLFLNT